MDAFLHAHIGDAEIYPPWQRAGVMLLHMLSTSATITLYYKALTIQMLNTPLKERKPMALMDSLNMIWIEPWKGLHVGYWGLAHLTYFFAMTLLARSWQEVMMVFGAGVVWELVENVAGRLIGRQTKGNNKHGRYHEGGDVQYLTWWAGTYVDIVLNGGGIILALLSQFFLQTQHLMLVTCVGLVGYHTFICYRIMKVQLRHFKFTNLFHVCVTFAFWSNHAVMGLFLPAEVFWMNSALFAVVNVTQMLYRGVNRFYWALLIFRLGLDAALFYLLF